MSLRIAFDLDGVVADMETELARCREKLFGADAASDPGVRRERKLWQHIESVENFWERLEELENGAVRRLAGIAGERAWEIIFITTRPASAGDTVQIQSQRWLIAKGFPLPSVYVVYGSRGKVAAALSLDVVVDDRLDNCLDVVADSTARPVLFVGGRSTDEGLPATAERLGISTVRTMKECLQLLLQHRPPETDKAGIVARVMRSLGLSEGSK